jgi:hypothetical protein
MLCVNSSTNTHTMTNQLVPRFLMSVITRAVMMLYTYMYPCGMVSQFIIRCIIFSGKAWFGPIYQGINSICQGNGSPSIYLNSGPSQGLGPIIFGIDWIYLFTHTKIIRIKLLIIYTIVTTSLMSGPPYQYLVFRNLSKVTFVLNISQGKPLLYNIKHLMR